MACARGQAWVQASEKIGTDLVDRIAFSDKAQNDEVLPTHTAVRDWRLERLGEGEGEGESGRTR